MVLGEVKRTFNPEFINRIDEIIVFEALTDEDLRRIMWLLIDQLNAQPGRPAAEDHAGAGGDRLDHRDHLQGPLVRRPSAAPRDPALRRGSAVRGADSRSPAWRRGRGLSWRAGRLHTGRPASSKPDGGYRRAAARSTNVGQGSAGLFLFRQSLSRLAPLDDQPLARTV
ncbi:MAG: hypothetical protein QM736_00910 [Vicinamibacterales bacterium]